MKKIGLYGGTFDPFHEGHLWVVEQSIKNLKLDCVTILPANKSPFKIHKKHFLTNIERLQSIYYFMDKSKYKNKINVSTYDMNNEQQCYTVETLKDFIYHMTPADQFSFYYIMGADSYCNIRKYKNWEYIFALARVVIAPREKYNEKAKELYDSLNMCKFFRRTIFLTGDGVNISSTMLRKIGEKSWKK